MSKADINGMKNADGISYGELIRRQRKRKRISQEELGALVNVGKNAVGAWEAGRSRPDISSVPVICDALDLSLNEFFGIRAEKYIPAAPDPETEAFARDFASLNPYNRRVVLREIETLREMQEEMEKPVRRLVCLYMNDLAVSAGTGEWLGDDRGESVWLFEDALTGIADEIIRVNGDSMEPDFSNGDRVLVQHTSSVREGEIGIFITPDGGFMKEYRKDGLYSRNPAYPVISFGDHDSVRCVGRVLGRLKKEQLADEVSIEQFRRAGQRG